MKKDKNLNVDEIFSLAVENHQKKELKKAVIYYEKVIVINQQHIDAYNNLGGIHFLFKEYQKAQSCYEKVIEIDPYHGQAHYNLGVLFRTLKDYQKSKSCYEKAIEIDPNFAAAHNNLGVIFEKLDQNNKAINYYKKAIEINPNYLQAFNNLGIILVNQDKYQEAKNYFKKVIEIDPKNKTAFNNLGSFYLHLKEHEKAIKNYEKAIEIDPNYISAITNLAQCYISQLNFEKGISSSYKALKTQYEHLKFINQSVAKFRLKHDVEQAKYLSSKNYKIDGIDEFQKMGNEILNREENKYNDYNVNKKILLTPDEVNTLLPFYKAHHIYKPKIISDSCINPNKNWQEVEDEYLNSSNQIMYIDDFLSDEALIELREFCLVSKVWNKQYDNKYLGAFAEQGFISPIHLQIAVDLKKKLPKIFGPHNLGKFWGFKYDSTLGEGINIHADFAIHNLNFWITPDEYNNNKKSGGLKVYDAPAPEHWTFKDYNRGGERTYKFLKDNNAKCTNVHYKFNRAVLFNSAYFHETDEIDFKDKYEGRRINNTYLFGNRLVVS